MDEFLRLIDAAAQDVAPRALADAFARIAADYASDVRRTRIASTTDALAYAVGRARTTSAVVERVLREVAVVRPEWEPRTVLDLGAGIGSGAWAAATIFDSIESVTCVERSAEMRDLGSRLGAAADRPSLRSARWIDGDVTQPSDATSDLVIASYVLGELPDDDVRGAARRWFAVTRDELVIVEAGTPYGFARVRVARSALIEDGATITAPCPHDSECPMQDNDWCHFAIRVARSRLHRHVKSGERGFEDEKYSYIVASQESATERRPRVLQHPQRHSGHVRLRLCAPGGIEDTIVARRDAELYRRARDTRWGDRFA